MQSGKVTDGTDSRAAIALTGTIERRRGEQVSDHGDAKLLSIVNRGARWPERGV